MDNFESENNSAEEENDENFNANDETPDEADNNGDQEVNNEHEQADEEKKAPIWRHFQEVIDANGTKYAKCIHNPCQTKYKMSGNCNSSTGNLIKHMARKHPEIMVIETVGQLDPFVFSQETFRHALLKWVIMCDQPFDAPQQQAFVDLINTLNPVANTVSDKTIKADLMAEYQTKLLELKTLISKIPGKISLTIDGWTSKNAIPFFLYLKS